MQPGYAQMVDPTGVVPQAPETTLPSPQPAYAAMQSQVPPEIQQMHVPARTPQELEQRKSGWAQVWEKVQTDPNLQRALMYFGQSAVQPMQPGQTPLGQFANAAVTGVNAYEFGKEAEFQRRLKEAQEGRAQRESDANVAGTEARTEGTILDNQVKSQTLVDAVANVKLAREKLELDIQNAKTDAEKKKLELDYQKRVDAIRKEIPDATIRSSLDAELQRNGLLNSLTKAQIGSAGASAGLAGAQAARVKAENDLLASLPDDEARRQYLAKTGPYATEAKSAQVAMTERFQKEWKVANPKKAGETDASYNQRVSQATIQYLTSARSLADSNEFFKWAELYGTGNFAADQAAYLKSKGQVPGNMTPGGATTSTKVRTFDASGKEVK